MGGLLSERRRNRRIADNFPERAQDRRGLPGGGRAIPKRYWNWHERAVAMEYAMNNTGGTIGQQRALRQRWRPFFGLMLALATLGFATSSAEAETYYVDKDLAAVGDCLGGTYSIAVPIPSNLLAGTVVYSQWMVQDPVIPNQFALSDARRIQP